jgi:predicted PolB exonuclease-like 3'-5' exonuclease
VGPAQSAQYIDTKSAKIENYIKQMHSMIPLDHAGQGVVAA